METSGQQITVLPDRFDERASRLAEAMTASWDSGAWTVQEVINAALERGLVALEADYLGSTASS